ncbi:MAG: preprotein translocase subunit SecE [Candidatus Adiutrix sp.]|jgi:preprotein translocase subunit SecE|nr:preprotein translocase subunit SecE [Candidatus Adiutrix sp.]
MSDNNTGDNDQTVLPASEVKTTLTRSEQRKKNRQELRSRKKTEPAGEASPGLLTQGYNFMVEAKQELAKVVWPSRKECVDATWRLLILVILAGLYLGLVDSILTRLLAFII